MTRCLPVLAILALGALLALGGCGGGNSSSSGEGGSYGSGESANNTAQSTKGGAEGEAGSSAGGPAAVAVAANPKLGKILVDSKGFTLYDFHKDKGSKSSCYGACAGVWPPLTTSGAPQAMSGATAAKLDTSKRSDGTLQVTYAGHPLYTYTADTKPGDAKGQDFDSYGAEWYALTPSGADAKD